MMRRRFTAFLLLGILSTLSRTELRAEFGFQGQLSFWLAFHDRPLSEGSSGLRYIPGLSWKKTLGGGLTIDAEASANAYGAVQGSSFRDLGTSGKIKPYRVWVRFAGGRFEARLGLQKINFGSAMLLRPLMWFDSIDPNDPLQLTDGVYGLLFKYTFLNNANIWLWGLYGNDAASGWQTIPTLGKAPEFGGRIQVPSFSGEMALSFHHRRLDTGRSPEPLPPGEKGDVPEDRIGFDGKWDIGPGVWIEAGLTRQGFVRFPLKYQKALSLGLDYTFSLGHGLHLLAEHLEFDASSGAWTSGQTLSLTALTMDYPLGLLDRIQGVVFHNWTNGDWYRLATWRRTYDKWSFFLIGFWNPAQYRIYAGQRQGNLFAGKGFQIMAVFNH